MIRTKRPPTTAAEKRCEDHSDDKGEGANGKHARSDTRQAVRERVPVTDAPLGRSAELILKFCEVVGHRRSCSSLRIRASPRLTRLRNTSSEQRIEPAISP